MDYTQIIGKKKDKKVKKNGEKCQYFFFHEKAKLESAAMVWATKEKLARIISAMASCSEIYEGSINESLADL